MYQGLLTSIIVLQQQDFKLSGSMAKLSKKTFGAIPKKNTFDPSK